jgi:RimJ/RimL family protein N-acetyltransferase
VRLTIRATAERDLGDLGRLWNDGRVMRWVGFPDGLGIDDASLRAWYDRVRRDPDRHHFVVRDEELGFCGELFYEVDRARRRAALDIKLIPDAQGRGIATAALSWLIERVFAGEPAVDAVWTEPWPENRASRALYARCDLVETVRPADLPPGPSYWERRRARPAAAHEPGPQAR